MVSVKTSDGYRLAYTIYTDKQEKIVVDLGCIILKGASDIKFQSLK